MLFVFLQLRSWPVAPAARVSRLTDRAMVLNASPGATTVSQGEHVSTPAYMCLMDFYNGRGLDSKTAIIYGIHRCLTNLTILQRLGLWWTR
jgi:hypothetical protein